MILDLGLNHRNLREAGSIPNLEAVAPEAAIGPLAGPVGRAVTGGITLGLLYRTNQVRPDGMWQPSLATGAK